MNLPNIKEYRFDYSGEARENYVHEERLTAPQDGNKNFIFAPRHAPFYMTSILITDKNGKLLIEDTDYEFVNLMGRLTERTAKPVGSLIKLLKPYPEVLASYQVVGSDSIIDQSIINLIWAGINDDRPMYFENLRNRPLVYRPKLHGHDLRHDVNGFTDVNDCLLRLFNLNLEEGNPLKQRAMNGLNTLRHYMALYRQSIQTYIDNHVGAYNAHGLTKAQADLANVDNFPTASISQQLEANRDDLHCTPKGLNALVARYRQNPFEFVKAGQLALLGFSGNTANDISFSGWNVNILREQKVVMNGNTYTALPGVLNLQDIVDSPANKTLYLYLTFKLPNPQYRVVRNMESESSGNALVARVFTGSSGITNIIREGVFSLRGYRLSDVRRGSALPVSTGVVTGQGTFPWFDRDPLIPENPDIASRYWETLLKVIDYSNGNTIGEFRYYQFDGTRPDIPVPPDKTTIVYDTIVVEDTVTHPGQGYYWEGDFGYSAGGSGDDGDYWVEEWVRSFTRDRPNSKPNSGDWKQVPVGSNCWGFEYGEWSHDDGELGPIYRERFILVYQETRPVFNLHPRDVIINPLAYIGPNKLVEIVGSHEEQVPRTVVLESWERVITQSDLFDLANWVGIGTATKTAGEYTRQTQALFYETALQKPNDGITKTQEGLTYTISKWYKVIPA